MKKIAKIILINDNNEFLLQFRDNKPNIVSPGEWALIGGGIKSGENILKGLEREIKEEIPDCCVKDIKYLGEDYFNTTFKDSNLSVHLYFFKGRINESINKINKKLTEGQKAGYFKLNQFKDIKFNDIEAKFIYKNRDNLLI